MPDCIFCQIIKKKIPAKTVYEDNRFLAFYDIKPAAPVHVVIIPKQHLEFNNLTSVFPDLPGQVAGIAQKIAKSLKIDDSGFRLVVNCGPDSGQEIAHIHWHLLGGGRLGPLA